MDRLHSKYNPEVNHKLALEAIAGVTKDEYKAWLDHPCTKTLRLKLLSSIDEMMLNMSQGAFIEDPIENARAVGMTQVLDATVNDIDDLLEEVGNYNVDEDINRTEGY